MPCSLVVAVDGPSGSGKSSVARAVASELGFRYLDTGAMYRAVTWWMLQQGVQVDDAAAVVAEVDRPIIEVAADPANPTISVDGVDVAEAIRGRDVTNAVSAVSRVPEVRRRLVSLQRALIGNGAIVVEGRDIGTVVAPSATVKVFLTADADARARRRNSDAAARLGTSLDVTRGEIARRDRLDSSRTSSPLTMADDAVEIDSTSLDLPDVVSRVLALVDGARAGTVTRT